MTIWKYILKPQSVQIVEMPEGSRILCAHSQCDEICIWVNVWPENTMQTRTIEVIATGEQFMEAPRDYIGTVKLENDRLIFHVFERTA